MRILTNGQRLPRHVRLLIAARAINQLGAFSLPFVTVLITTDFGASIGTAGVITAAFGLATIPSRLLGGRLADRLGRRRTIVVGLLGCAVAQLGIAASPSLPTVTIAVVSLGLAFEIYEPASQAMLADAVGRSGEHRSEVRSGGRDGAEQDNSTERVHAYNVLGAALSIAGMVSGLIAAGVGRWDLRWLFVADAVTCLGCAVIVRTVLPGDRPGSTRPKTARMRAWRDPALIGMLVSGTLFALIQLDIMMSLPLSLVHHGLRGSDAGLLFTVSAITTVAGQPLLRMAWLSRWPEPVGLAVGYAVLAVGLGGYATAGTLPGFLAATVVCSLGNLFMIGRALAIVVALAPDGGTGRYLAVYGVGWGVAGVGAPIIGTQIIGYAGPAALWIGLAGLSVLLAAGQLMIIGPLVGRADAGTGPRMAEPASPAVAAGQDG